MSTQRPTRAAVPLRSGVSGERLQVLTTELEQQDVELLDELTRRLASIGHSYSILAQQVGALYIRADESGLDSLTQALDRPMRNASNDQQAFDALQEATLQAKQDREGN